MLETASRPATTVRLEIADIGNSVLSARGVNNRTADFTCKFCVRYMGNNIQARPRSGKREQAHSIGRAHTIFVERPGSAQRVAQICNLSVSLEIVSFRDDFLCRRTARI